MLVPLDERIYMRKLFFRYKPRLRIVGYRRLRWPLPGLIFKREMFHEASLFVNAISSHFSLYYLRIFIIIQAVVFGTFVNNAFSRSWEKTEKFICIDPSSMHEKKKLRLLLEKMSIISTPLYFLSP